MLIGSAKPHEEDFQEKCHKGSDVLKISAASYIQEGFDDKGEDLLNIRFLTSSSLSVTINSQKTNLSTDVDLIM